MSKRIEELATEKRAVYQAPSIERLGTLAELTQGTDSSSGDALSGGLNGGDGSL